MFSKTTLPQTSKNVSPSDVVLNSKIKHAYFYQGLFSLLTIVGCTLVFALAIKELSKGARIGVGVGGGVLLLVINVAAILYRRSLRNDLNAVPRAQQGAAPDVAQQPVGASERIDPQQSSQKGSPKPHPYLIPTPKRVLSEGDSDIGENGYDGGKPGEGEPPLHSPAEAQQKAEEERRQAEIHQQELAEESRRRKEAASAAQMQPKIDLQPTPSIEQLRVELDAYFDSIKKELSVDLKLTDQEIANKKELAQNVDPDTFLFYLQSEYGITFKISDTYSILTKYSSQERTAFNPNPIDEKHRAEVVSALLRVIPKLRAPSVVSAPISQQQVPPPQPQPQPKVALSAQSAGAIEAAKAATSGQAESTAATEQIEKEYAAQQEENDRRYFQTLKSSKEAEEKAAKSKAEEQQKAKEQQERQELSKQFADVLSKCSQQSWERIKNEYRGNNNKAADGLLNILTFSHFPAERELGNALLKVFTNVNPDFQWPTFPDEIKNELVVAFEKEVARRQA